MDISLLEVQMDEILTAVKEYQERKAYNARIDRIFLETAQPLVKCDGHSMQGHIRVAAHRISQGRYTKFLIMEWEAYLDDPDFTDAWRQGERMLDEYLDDSTVQRQAIKLFDELVEDIAEPMGRRLHDRVVAIGKEDIPY